MTYSGKATTVGNSKALSFESAFFKAHPEFAAGRVQAHVIAPGTMLVTSTESPAPDAEEDPVILAFLSFLEQEMAHHPESIQPLDAQLIADMDELVGDIEIDLNEDFGEDARLP